MSIHEEEVLGKAYDARLMRRLLALSVAVPAAGGRRAGVDLCASVLQLAQPYLMKIAIDRYIAAGDLAGLDRIALRVPRRSCWRSFALEYVQTWMMQMTGQRIMFDMRMQIYGHLQRLDLQFYDRNPVGRLMTRVTTDVDVLNDLFTAGVVSIFGDVFMLAGIMIVLLVDGLAARAGRLLGAAAHRARHAVVPAQRARVVPDGAHAGSRGSTRSCRSTSPAWRRCSCSGGSARSFERFDEINRAAPRRERRVDLLLRRVLSGDRSHRRAGGGADHLVRRRLDARRAR